MTSTSESGQWTGKHLWKSPQGEVTKSGITCVQVARNKQFPSSRHDPCQDFTQKLIASDLQGSFLLFLYSFIASVKAKIHVVLNSIIAV